MTREFTVREREREREVTHSAKGTETDLSSRKIKITEYFHLKKEGKNNNNNNRHKIIAKSCKFHRDECEVVNPREIITSCQARLSIRDVDEIEWRNVTACVRRRVVGSARLSTLEPREG